MPKLTDTQLVILSTAAPRKDQAVLPLAKSLKVKGAALTRTLEALCNKGLLEEKRAGREDMSWRESDDSRRMMLLITDKGLQAINVEAAGKPKTQTNTTKTRTRKSRSHAGLNTASAAPTGNTASPGPRPGSKQSLIIDLLRRKGGATIDEMVETTGWQAHSVRGAISGTLKKKLGLAVSSEKVEGGSRVYRIMA